MAATIIAALLIGTSAMVSNQTANGVTLPFQPKVQTNAIHHISNGVTVNCGDYITTSVKLTKNIICTSLSNGINIGASNIVLNCNHNWITGGGDGTPHYIGIASFFNSGVTIKDCNVEGFDGGIVTFDSSDQITNNNVRFSNVNGIVSEGINDLIESNVVSKTVGTNQQFIPFSGDGFFEFSTGDSLTKNKSNHNAEYGFDDFTTGAGTSGTANVYNHNHCDHDTLGKSLPAGLC